MDIVAGPDSYKVRMLLDTVPTGRLVGTMPAFLPSKVIVTIFLIQSDYDNRRNRVLRVPTYEYIFEQLLPYT